MALLSYLDTIVSMDSANMHLASLVGVRVVSIWGSHSLILRIQGIPTA